MPEMEDFIQPMSFQVTPAGADDQLGEMSKHLKEIGTSLEIVRNTGGATFKDQGDAIEKTRKELLDVLGTSKNIQDIEKATASYRKMAASDLDKFVDKLKEQKMLYEDINAKGKSTWMVNADGQKMELSNLLSSKDNLDTVSQTLARRDTASGNQKITQNVMDKADKFGLGSLFRGEGLNIKDSLPKMLGGLFGEEGASLVGTIGTGLGVAGIGKIVGDQAIAKYDELRKTGMVQGDTGVGAAVAGAGAELQARMLTLSPFINYQQGKEIVNSVYQAGYKGRTADTVMNFVSDNFVGMGMSVNDSMNLMQEAVTKGGARVSDLSLRLAEMHDAATASNVSLATVTKSFTQMTTLASGLGAGKAAPTAGADIAELAKSKSLPAGLKKETSMIGAGLQSQQMRMLIQQKSHKSYSESMKESPEKYFGTGFELLRQTVQQLGGYTDKNMWLKNNYQLMAGKQYLQGMGFSVKNDEEAAELLTYIAGGTASQDLQNIASKRSEKKPAPFAEKTFGPIAQGLAVGGDIAKQASLSTFVRPLQGAWDIGKWATGGENWTDVTKRWQDRLSAGEGQIAQHVGIGAAEASGKALTAKEWQGLQTGDVGSTAKFLQNLVIQLEFKGDANRILTGKVTSGQHSSGANLGLLGSERNSTLPGEY